MAGWEVESWRYEGEGGRGNLLGSLSVLLTVRSLGPDPFLVPRGTDTSEPDRVEEAWDGNLLLVPAPAS